MELIKNITETANERLKSPFIASFIFAWLALNWEVFAIIFGGDGEMKSRILFVNQEYFKWGSFLWAWGIAVLYAVVLPYITSGLEYLTANARVSSDRSKHVRRTQELEYQRTTARLVFETKQEEEGVKDLEKLTNENKVLVEKVRVLENKLLQAQNNHNDQSDRSKKLKDENEKLHWELEFNRFQTDDYLTVNFRTVVEIFGNSIEGKLSRKIDDEDIDLFIDLGLILETTKRGTFKYTEKGYYFAELFNQRGGGDPIG